MSLILRIDLDYVPWDTPDAAEFGHGEPAVFLKLLDLARITGSRLQFFVSNRVLRAFPATAEAVLNEGHDLDWFSKHPEAQEERFEEAKTLFASIGHQVMGVCVRGSWPDDAPFPPELKFLSSSPGFVPLDTRHFAVDTKSDREAMRVGLSARAWTDTLKTHLREAATRSRRITVAVRPQVLAKYDPKLSHIKEILDMARAVELPLRTCRQEMSLPGVQPL